MKLAIDNIRVWNEKENCFRLTKETIAQKPFDLATTLSCYAAFIDQQQPDTGLDEIEKLIHNTYFRQQANQIISLMNLLMKHGSGEDITADLLKMVR